MFPLVLKIKSTCSTFKVSYSSKTSIFAALLHIASSVIMEKKEWFDEWFNTIYYHILYKNRDYQEAGKFLDRLINYFNISTDSKILDLACGKGRHSIYLNEKGFEEVYSMDGGFELWRGLYPIETQ